MVYFKAVQIIYCTTVHTALVYYKALCMEYYKAVYMVYYTMERKCNKHITNMEQTCAQMWTNMGRTWNEHRTTWNERGTNNTAQY